MKERGLTQYRLWKDMRIGINTARWLASGNPPKTLRTALKAADYFKIDVGELFE